jgi:hypothetical protein
MFFSLWHRGRPEELYLLIETSPLSKEKRARLDTEWACTMTPAPPPLTYRHQPNAHQAQLYVSAGWVRQEERRMATVVVELVDTLRNRLYVPHVRLCLGPVVRIGLLSHPEPSTGLGFSEFLEDALCRWALAPVEQNEASVGRRVTALVGVLPYETWRTRLGKVVGAYQLRLLHHPDVATVKVGPAPAVREQVPVLPEPLGAGARLTRSKAEVIHEEEEEEDDEDLIVWKTISEEPVSVQ